MNELGRESTETLVEVHKAPDAMVGQLLVGYLRDNDIEASFQGDSNIPLDITEFLKNSDQSFGIFVLQHNAARAQGLIREFLAAGTNPALLDEAAARKLKITKETITRLRGELIEERRTFSFLGWTGAIFLGAGALLWIIWPEWLKMETPPSGLRWMMILLLTFGAVIAGRSTNK